MFTLTFGLCVGFFPEVICDMVLAHRSVKEMKIVYESNPSSYRCVSVSGTHHIRTDVQYVLRCSLHDHMLGLVLACGMVRNTIISCVIVI